MPRCAGSKPTGEPCERIVGASQSYCFSHDPDRADQRRRAASKAGKSKPNRDVADIKRRLSELADGVLDRSVDKGVGAVTSQILNVYLRAVSIELKIKETDELEAKLDEMAAALERQERSSTYGSAG